MGADWGETVPLCKEGREQSPIDLGNWAMQRDKADLSIDLYSYEDEQYQEPTKYDENGQTPAFDYSWKINVNENGGSLYLRNGEGQTGEFQPLQFHFHAPSEHTVEGYYYPAEVHFVHLGCRDGNQGNQCGEVAVLGIFFETMNPYEDNPFLEQVFGAFETRDWPEGQGKVSVDIDALMNDLVTDAYWSYQGSFTTPPCTEGVQWTVLKTPQNISYSQLERFCQYL